MLTSRFWINAYREDIALHSLLMNTSSQIDVLTPISDAIPTQRQYMVTHTASSADKLHAQGNRCTGYVLISMDYRFAYMNSKFLPCADKWLLLLWSGGKGVCLKTMHKNSLVSRIHLDSFFSAVACLFVSDTTWSLTAIVEPDCVSSVWSAVGVTIACSRIAGCRGGGPLWTNVLFSVGKLEHLVEWLTLRIHIVIEESEV